MSIESQLERLCDLFEFYLTEAYGYGEDKEREAFMKKEREKFYKDVPAWLEQEESVKWEDSVVEGFSDDPH